MKKNLAIFCIILPLAALAQVWEVKTASDPLSDQVVTSARSVVTDSSGRYNHELQLIVGAPPDLTSLTAEAMDGVVIKVQFSIEGVSPAGQKLAIKFRTDSNPVADVGWTREGQFANVGVIHWIGLEKDIPRFDILGNLRQQEGKYEAKIRYVSDQIAGAFPDAWSNSAAQEDFKKANARLREVVEQLSVRQKIDQIAEILAYFQNASDRIVLSSLVDKTSSVVFRIGGDYAKFAQACQAVRTKVVTQLKMYDLRYGPIAALETMSDKIAAQLQARKAAEERARRESVERSTAMDSELKAKGRSYFEVKELDQAPVPTHQAGPDYPLRARQDNIQGEVLVAFIIDASGSVQEAVAVRSTNKIFEPNAVEAVKKWRFRPGIKNGVGVPSLNYVPIVFRLGEDQ